MEPPTSVQVNNLPVGADLAQDERPSRADRVRAKVKRGNRRPVELLNRQILRLNQRAPATGRLHRRAYADANAGADCHMPTRRCGRHDGKFLQVNGIDDPSSEPTLLSSSSN
jgi:hypothetical protein